MIFILGVIFGLILMMKIDDRNEKEDKVKPVTKEDIEYDREKDKEYYLKFMNAIKESHDKKEDIERRPDHFDDELDDDLDFLE